MKPTTKAYLPKGYFQIGVTSLSAAPQSKAEVAIAGRSNVGKSSLLAVLIGNKGDVRISKTPGRTRELNFFAWGQRGLQDDYTDRYLVDVPGFGYAKMSQTAAQQTGRLLQNYFASRTELTGLILLCDVRRPLREEESDLLVTCLDRQMDIALVLNKVDKVSQSQVQKRLKQLKVDELPQLWPDLSRVTFFTTSATKGKGVDPLARWLVDHLKINSQLNVPNSM